MYFYLFLVVEESLRYTQVVMSDESTAILLYCTVKVSMNPALK